MRILSLLIVCMMAPVMSGASCGNVFLEGDTVRVSLPIGSTSDEGNWRVLNDCYEQVGSGTWSGDGDDIEIDRLPLGWYQIVFSDTTSQPAGFTTAAVLAQQQSARQDSPVALDVALSWVPEADPEVWQRCVALARMAGVTMVRDRLRWRDLQPASGPFLPETIYDATARLQQKAELQVLQVFHQTPEWVYKDARDRGHVPRDLRDTWRFCKELAGRFHGRVQAWQPWNEGNADNFGGHTIDELCSHQKAAFWGFRAGDPELMVCWAPLGGVNSEALCKGITDNGTAAYFDIFSMHSYDWPHDYAKLRQWALKAAAGKPLWVTESDRGIKTDPDSPLGDLTRENERRKAEFITQSIASSLAAGASRHFHFILPQYLEQDGQVQFGLLRHDQSPRMGYVALAAAGRLLAGARYLGRLENNDAPERYVYAFRAWPDGLPRDVLVAWAEAPVDWPERGRTRSPLGLPLELSVMAVYDFLGRSLGVTPPETTGGAPLFILLPEGAADILTLQAPCSSPLLPATEEPSPVVLQFSAPDMPIRGRIINWAHEHDRIMAPGVYTVTIYAYNFGDKLVSGTIEVTGLSPAWQCEPMDWSVTLEPMERLEQALQLVIPEPGSKDNTDDWVRLTGNFGDAGKALLAVRIRTHNEP